MEHRGTILQRHSGDRLAGQRGHRQVNIRRVHLPLVSEIRDDSAHEGLDRGLRGGMVAEMIGQQRQCELARLGTLVTPLEAVLAELHDVHARIERCAVDGDLDAVDGPVSPIMLHSALLVSKPVRSAPGIPVSACRKNAGYQLPKRIPLSWRAWRACCHTINISKASQQSDFSRAAPVDNFETFVAGLIDW